MKATESLAGSILREAEDDWIPLDMLLWHARQSAATTGDGFEKAAIEVLRVLLERGWMEIGDLADSGFVAWTDPVGEILRRVRADCEAVDWEPLGGLYWLSITPAGLRHVS
ncbi:hypothetical protein [Streptomyces sp. H27-D2]|uniref:hypothetical protein n=1 Tax=Streptomyces sp. H27-D2 TaxID=3046304 RepID=UPI002DBC040F|nr:hypothetical protein [Streptomyces sp. H27-D2]MEC4016556.1 hypothetical protein [Streptomyces sp. H27-D2]